MQNSPRIYLDYHATTPVHPEVWKTMERFSTEQFHNPSGLYAGSVRVQAFVGSAAGIVRNHLCAPDHEVVFTSGATEANNLALKAFGFRDAPGALLMSPIEHKSVIATGNYLHGTGVERHFLRVDAYGHVDLDDLEAKLRRGAWLVSVMAVNNEVGTVAHLDEIAWLCREHDALFHCDATQAMDNVRLDMTQAPIDLLSFSAHKIHGPKGIGCLVVSPKAMDRFERPHTHGGGQQLGMRAGTENVPGIAGLAKALEICARDFERHVEHRRDLRDRLLAGLRVGCDIDVNGDPLRRHPGNLHVSFRRVSPQHFFSRCDRIDFSTGSACNNASGEVSHVLKQIGLCPDAIKSSMRLSVGMATTLAEVDAAIDIISRAHTVATT